MPNFASKLANLQPRDKSTRMRSFRTGNFGVELDMFGGQTAWIKSVSGGHVRAEVARQRASNDEVTIRRVQNVIVEPIVFEQSVGAATPLYTWIQESWKRNFSRCNGVIFHANARFEVEYEHIFLRALITEVTFPAFDAKAKEPAYLTIEIQPEEVFIKRQKKPIPLFGFKESAQPKAWNFSHFRLRLFNAGDEIDCSGVQRIESFKLRQRTTETGAGARRFSEREPTGLDFPELQLTVPLGMAEDFFNWYEKFLMVGEDQIRAEKQGLLEVLDPGYEHSLLTFALDKVGMESLEIEKNDAHADGLQMCKVTLYVGSMDLIVVPGG